jgi:hypothetical protein
MDHSQGNSGHRLTYDGKFVLCPFSGFQRLSSGIAVIETATDNLVGILPSSGGHHVWTLSRLALQNLGRRRTRTTLLISAVAISSAIVFTGIVMLRSIETSMAGGFSRLGADLMVVTQNTLTNITAALGRPLIQPNPMSA